VLLSETGSIVQSRPGCILGSLFIAYETANVKYASRVQLSAIGRFLESMPGSVQLSALKCILGRVQ